MPDQIVISKAAIGGRFLVSFEPRSVSWPSLEFRHHGEAKRCADARHAAHGWPVIDQTAEGGEA
ncbi:MULTISPECIES: hypothetical protein [unclassified Sphingobium]|uniref:hypothetical protein n=1 Tax=unclassified Sphingobium TaxID=2611147 RepID=UPI0005CB95FF|nr:MULTISPECIES: hypothetical protein [unclassified Sphingobium]AJR22514.1 hypothetical protein TZ53_00645 [Sphingobium sp. YBL2]UXC89502.1 hypothetical protein EGM87_10470 [Sphingobium sp. RSMS]